MFWNLPCLLLAVFKLACDWSAGVILQYKRSLKCEPGPTFGKCIYYIPATKLGMCAKDRKKWKAPRTTSPSTCCSDLTERKNIDNEQTKWNKRRKTGIKEVNEQSTNTARKYQEWCIDNLLIFPGLTSAIISLNKGLD